MPAPSSTYRVGLGAEFTFADLSELADHVARLGAGAVSTSPLWEMTPGSRRDDDVADPTTVSAQLGGEPDRRRAVRRLHERGLGLVVDVVPGYLGVAVPQANPWWWELLRDGPASRYAPYFDVDWTRGPLLLPVLADSGDSGTAGATGLRVDGDCLVHGERRFPIAPGTAGGTPEEVHGRQHYRLVSRRWWPEVNYGHAPGTADLAAVRAADAAVFDDCHADVVRWLHAGEVAGLCVRHPGALADPAAYLRRLRAAAREAWLVVDEVPAAGEELPASWPVDGTTGDDALRELCGVFVDPRAESAATVLPDRRDHATGVPPAEFHVAAARREAGWPATMTALAPRDTGLAEDLRARLAVLAEVVAEFAEVVHRHAARHPLPRPVLEPLAWQVVAGTWPVDAASLRRWLVTAARRADPQRPLPESVEHDVRVWIEAVLADDDVRVDLDGVADRIRGPGWSNALGQKLLQLAGPGVPEIHEGTEVWDESLPGPHRRPPVDIARRRALLRWLDDGLLPELDDSGMAKLLVVSRTLRLRRDRPELFGGYRALAASGPAAEHAVAFARGRRWRLVALATRLPVRLAGDGGWRDTALPLPGETARWVDALTGEVHSGHSPAVADLLHRYPVALLVGAET